jgi:hypothetical protein
MTDIQAPDGTIARFPDGMADADIISVMRQHYPAPPTCRSAQQQERRRHAFRAAKGAATGAIKGLSNSLGSVGNLSNFAN